MYFDSEAMYVTSQATMAARVTAIETCIDALLNEVLVSVGKASTSEYMLNDGQTIIKTVYRNPDEVMGSVERLEKLKTYYQNQLNGRVVRLVGAKNIYPHKRQF